jgi:hypothetical protein
MQLATPNGPSGSDHPSGARCCVGHVWMTRDQYRRLEREAMARRKHPDALIAEIVDTVIDDGLFAALLDL